MTLNITTFRELCRRASYRKRPCRTCNSQGSIEIHASIRGGTVVPRTMGTKWKAKLVWLGSALEVPIGMTLVTPL